MTRFADWSLGRKMLVLILLASSLPLAIASMITYRREYARAREASIGLLGARADQLVGELEGFHRTYLGAVTRLAVEPNTVAFIGGDDALRAGQQDAMAGRLERFKATDPNFSDLAVIDATGRILANTARKAIGTNVAYRQYFKAALKGRAIVSDLFVALPAGGAVPVIAYAAPTRDPETQEITGVVVVAVHAEAFWDAVKRGNGRAGLGSFSVLFDAYGIRIAHSFNDAEVYHPGGPLDKATMATLEGERRFDVKTHELLTAVSEVPGEFVRAREPTVRDETAFRGWSPANKKWNLIVTRKLTSVPWTLFYLVPEETLTGQAERLVSGQLIVSAAILLLALLVGLYVSRQIVAPARGLAAAAVAVARGDDVALLPVVGQDELGVLAVRFNEMAAAVKASRVGLEARVRERTIDLERATEELMAQKQELQAQGEELRAQQSELQAKNAEVERANRLKSEFLANMSHELRTPLNSVIGFTNLVLDETRGILSPEQRGWMEDVLQSGKHLLTLINDILDLSKIEAGQMTQKLVDVPVEEAIGEAARLVEHAAARKHITLREEVTATQRAHADAGQLRQVLLNLVSNAVKFSPERSTVVVRGADAGAFVRFEVTDQGPGIDHELRSRLFTPFTQGESPLVKKHEGTGLGLAISKRLVEHHGGQIDCAPATPRGTTFWFTIPAGEHHAGPIVRPTSGRPIALLVEDDAAVAAELRERMRGAGYDVVHVTNGSDALTLAIELRPAAVLVNPAAEKRDALGLLDALERRVETKDIPVIVMAAPGAAFLPKPIDGARLVDSLARIAARGDAPPHVLAIDDDPRLGVVLRPILEAARYRLSYFESARAGLAAAFADPPDAILLDLVMPEMSGFEVIAALAADERTRACPVIVLTGAELDERDRARLKQHARALAAKGDVSADALLVSISRAIAKVGPRAPAEAPKILVVDDHDLNRELVRALLDRLGYQVLLAEDGDAGVAVARRERPALVLMDLAMPGKNGYEAARELKAAAETSSIPVVALTALAMRGDERKAIDAGFDGYLTKPIDRELLATTIARLIGAGAKP